VSLFTYTNKEMMSKVFLTGMSAPQASSSANHKSLSFAGVINQVLTSAGHEVTWASPSVYMSRESLDKFDAVLVGVSPVSSVGSNRVYGALSVINMLKDSNKLTLFVDAPNTSQIEPSLKSVINNPDTLTKPFFSYRKEYSNVVADKELLDSVISGAKYLYTQDWVTTIYPQLPWKSSTRLPSNAKKNLVGINLDSHLVVRNPVETDRRPKWVIDNLSTPWAKNTMATLSLPNSLMKWNKGWTDAQVLEQISRSIGAVIAPDKRDGTYWSYRYAQAMSTNTPVVTDWVESHALGDAWNILATNIDTMSQDKRNLIATAQREIYLANIPSKQNAVDTLQQLIFRRD
jgi:hypothetical protein